MGTKYYDMMITTSMLAIFFQFMFLCGALVAIYVAVTNRITKLETEHNRFFDFMDEIKKEFKDLKDLIINNHR